MVCGPSPSPSPRSGGEREPYLRGAASTSLKSEPDWPEVLMRGRARSEGFMFESPYVVSYLHFEEEDQAEADYEAAVIRAAVASVAA
jgi:hypothetical protein